MTSSAFWDNAAFARSYVVTLQGAGDLAADLQVFPTLALAAAEEDLCEVLHDGTAAFSSLSSTYPVGVTELIALVSLLLGAPDRLARLETVEEATRPGLEVQMEDPNLRRFAGALVTEDIVPVETSPVRFASLAALVGAASAAVAILLGPIPGLAVPIASTG